MFNDGEALKCQILGARTAKVTLAAQKNLILHGTIGNFLNPHSIKKIAGMTCSLYSRKGVAKIVSSGLEIDTFTPSKIDAKLSSTSNVVGATGQTLKITLDPTTKITWKGIITLRTPEYYKDARDYMFGDADVRPCTSDKGTVKECKFQSRFQLLTIRYELTSKKDDDSEIIFFVSKFNNPIVEDQKGFVLEIMDEEENLIAELNDTPMEGITVPATFDTYDFNYVDLKNSGQYAVHQIILESNIPIQKGCRFRIVFPPDFKVYEAKVITLSGLGFFVPEGGTIKRWVNEADNSIDLVACQVNYGKQKHGVLKITSILNQPFVHDLETFKIYMTEEADVNFLSYYQKIDEGFIIREAQQRAGLMTGVLAASNNMVDTFSHLNITLQPTLDLSTQSYITIEVPQTLQFQGPSCTVSQHKGFSNLISCARHNHNIKINMPFDDKAFVAKGAEKLEMTVEEFLMPKSVQNIGNIEVITWDIREGEFRQIDILDLDTLASKSGKLSKVGSGATVSSAKTSLTNQEYTFNFKMTHEVPVGGFFSILLSKNLTFGVSITNKIVLENNCYLVEDGGDKGLKCVSGRTEEGRAFVNISCTESGFGETGTPKGQEVKFKIKGLTNPRTKGYESFFKIYTLDKEYRYIDENPEDQRFSVKMTQLMPLTSFTIEQKGKVNGAVTQYSMTILPNAQIHQGDVLSVGFPPGINIPADLKCSSNSLDIFEVTCARLSERKAVIRIVEMDHESLVPGVAFNLNFDNIQNAATLRPSEDFSEIVILNGDLEITSYDPGSSEGIVSVKNNELGKIDETTASIIQGSYQPLAEALVQITFKTNNAIPTTAAIQIVVPPSVSEVYPLETSQCQIKLNNVVVEGEVCVISDRTIRFVGAFAKNTESFEGRISIFFMTKNPKDNTNIKKQAYAINIYDDEDFQYGVDELVDEIFPRMGCGYPCKTCHSDDPDYCTTCLAYDTAPQFLFLGDPLTDASEISSIEETTGRPYVNRQTCKDSCPDGFTSDGTKDPRICRRCTETCLTCAQNDEPGDIARCVTCKDQFPFYWRQEQKCFSNECPVGSFEVSTELCQSCTVPCAQCSDADTCTKCNELSRHPYLYLTKCLGKCPYGYTPFHNNCTKCEPPCATCDDGLVHACRSCDNTALSQFLYGHQCVQECPIATVRNFEVKKCLPCPVGCDLCDDQDPTICKTCSPGQSLLDNACLDTCPESYLKSEDGTVCEKRTYALDDTFVAYPILGTAAFFAAITLASYTLTGRRSLVSSTLLAFFGPIEMAACFYQFLYSIRPDRWYVPIMVGSICVFISGVITNIIFVVSFRKHVLGRDKEFERWRRIHKCSSQAMLLLAGGVCLTSYRLIFCRIFRLESCSVKLNKPQPFLKPILTFTWVRFLVFNLPLIIVDLVGLSYLDWGNQCHMTMTESLTLSLCTLALIAWEWSRKTSLILREGKQLNLDKMEFDNYSDYDGFGGYGAHPNKMQGELKLRAQLLSGRLSERDRGRGPSPRSRQFRLKLFNKVMDTVQENKEKNLNSTLDNVLKVQTDKVRKALRRSHSMGDYKSKTHNELMDDYEELSEVPSQAKSFPALDINEEERLKEIHDFFDEMERKRLDDMEKGDQYSDPESDNVYADVHEPSEEIQMDDIAVQTEQDKGGQAQNEKNAERMAAQINDRLVNDLLLKKAEDSRLKRKRKQFRRGKRSFYENAIEEEDDDSEKSDKVAQNMIPTGFDAMEHDMLAMAMQVEKNQSLTSLWDLNEQQKTNQKKMMNQMVNDLEMSQDLLIPNMEVKGIELSRVSGDLDFSEEDVDLNEDPVAKQMAERLKIENVNAWIKDSSDATNQRNFNENEIIGAFPRDWDGSIIDREYTLRKAGFVDNEGHPVNERGYLINEQTGDIRSRYSYDVVFKYNQLVGVDGGSNVEIPLPFRIERYNFNPHQCFGNFDYDDREIAIIFKDKNGNRIDKNLRPVNGAGWLVDAEGNIIDNRGQIKLMKSQLTDKGDIPKLYNYEGKEYKIKNIMGLFDRDKNSKEIKALQDKNVCYDKKLRKVNCKGYILDYRGNIVDKNDNVVWHSHELMYNEPPKIFKFTEFSMNWIKGNLDVETFQKPSKHIKKKVNTHFDEEKEQKVLVEYDLDGNRVNTLGYLVDSTDNVIDVFRKNLLFKKDILEDRYGQEAQIPYIFRSGMLRTPLIQDDPIERELQRRHDISKIVQKKRMEKHEQYDDEEILMELQRLDKEEASQNVFKRLQDGELATVKDEHGDVVNPIYMNDEQVAMFAATDNALSSDYHQSQQYDQMASPHYPAQGKSLKKKKGGKGGPSQLPPRATSAQPNPFKGAPGAFSAQQTRAASAIKKERPISKERLLKNSYM